MPAIRTRSGGDLSVGQLSIPELQAELERRLNNLRQEREQLLERVAIIDRQLDAISPGSAAEITAEFPAGTNGRRTSTRPKNEKPLRVHLIEIIRAQGPMVVRELAAAVEDRGYQSSARNFTATVSTTLTNRPEFERNDDGAWTITDAADGQGDGQDGHDGQGGHDDGDDDTV